MLRDVVGTFLDTLTEREFDGPLVAILGARGFTDIHFIHGAFEFGKDVVAKRSDPVTGEIRQYVIQSKAGDIGLPEWHAVRPQLEQCEYNTLGHPSFDATLPRVAVLVTTGRLKGAAPADAAEYSKSVAARGLAALEIWEKSDLLEWMCDDPQLGVAGETVQVELLSVLTSVLDQSATDKRLEAYGRNWLSPTCSTGRSMIEAAILINALLRVRRLDLAIVVALQLVRATYTDVSRPTDAMLAAIRLVRGLATSLLDQFEPLLGDDPLEVARHTVSQIGQVNYLVICCRVTEAFALGMAIARAGDASSDAADAERFRKALTAMAEQPGAARPPSDLFAASVIATAVMLNTVDPLLAGEYLTRCAKWLLDRHDEDLAGLGLASISEDEETTVARLLGGSLESTTVECRTSSYFATALLDLALFLRHEELYEALRANLDALRVVPESTSADETRARWARGGSDVWPQPRVEFESWEGQAAKPSATTDAEPAVALLLTSACRSRHYPGLWNGLTA